MNITHVACVDHSRVDRWIKNLVCMFPLGKAPFTSLFGALPGSCLQLQKHGSRCRIWASTWFLFGCQQGGSWCRWGDEVGNFATSRFGGQPVALGRSSWGFSIGLLKKQHFFGLNPGRMTMSNIFFSWQSFAGSSSSERGPSSSGRVKPPQNWDGWPENGKLIYWKWQFIVKWVKWPFFNSDFS